MSKRAIYPVLLAITSLALIQGPLGAVQGIVSTTAIGKSTALGAHGTGGSTYGGSFWFYYDGGYPNYEKINWKLNCSNTSTDYDMYLYNCQSSYPGTMIASATSISYPDSIVYQCTSSIRYLLLEIRYYSGPTSSLFYLSGVRRPLTMATCLWLNARNQTLYGYPNTTNPQDGIEGYNPYASTERGHWYATTIPAWMTNNDSTFRYKIKSAAGNYDLYVYDSNYNLVGWATSTSNPEYTNWIRYRSLPSQYLYLEVYSAGNTNAEYRVDDGGSSVYGSGVEEALNDMLLPLTFSIREISPNPSYGRVNISYQLAEPGDVDIDIYNILGEIVKKERISNQSSGNHVYRWNGRDNRNSRAGNGTYIVRLSTDGKGIAKKFIIVK